MSRFQFWIYSWIRFVENFICIITCGFIQPCLMSYYYLDYCFCKSEAKPKCPKRDSCGRFCK